MNISPICMNSDRICSTASAVPRHCHSLPVSTQIWSSRVEAYSAAAPSTAPETGPARSMPGGCLRSVPILMSPQSQNLCASTDIPFTPWGGAYSVITATISSFCQQACQQCKCVCVRVWRQSAIAQAQQVRAYIYTHTSLLLCVCARYYHYYCYYYCVCVCAYANIFKLISAQNLQVWNAQRKGEGIERIQWSVGARAGKEPVAPPSVAAAPWILASTMWKKCQEIL